MPYVKQIELMKCLNRNQRLFEELRFSGIPKKDQFDQVFDLMVKFLFTERYKNNRTPGHLNNVKYYAKGYVYRGLSLKDLALAQESKVFDTKLRSALKLINDYFEFALPKYLIVFQNVFNYMCERLGRLDDKMDLELLIMKLEYGFTKPHEIALKEAGMPSMVIRNISEKFMDCKSIVDIREMYNKNYTLIEGLHPYEQKIFKKYI